MLVREPKNPAAAEETVLLSFVFESRENARAETTPIIILGKRLMIIAKKLPFSSPKTGMNGEKTKEVTFG